MDIYLHTIDGDLKDIVLEPTEEEQDNMASCCDDRENYNRLKGDISLFHPQLLIHFGKACQQLIEKGDNKYIIPKEVV